MGSINISLNDEAYKRLKNAKMKGESFSEAVIRITSEKDITRCFGLLKEHSEELDKINDFIEDSRKEKWREIW
jgi:predicted CopG family antitoxin